MAYSVTPEHNALPRVSLARGAGGGWQNRRALYRRFLACLLLRVHNLGPGWERIVAKAFAVVS